MSLQLYEVVIALNPQTTESKQKEFFSQVVSVIKKSSGSLHHIDNLGTRALANTGKQRGVKRAVYFHLSYKALGSVVQEVERLFKINDFVLYFHHEKLDSRISLDKHQEKFEHTLQISKEKEEERQAYLQMKRKKYIVPETTQKEISS